MADTDVTPAEAASLDRAGKYSNTVYQEGANDYGLRGDGYLINFPGGLNDLGIVGRMVARIGAWIATTAPGLVAAAQTATDKAAAAATSAQTATDQATIATNKAGAAATSAQTATDQATIATNKAAEAVAAADRAATFDPLAFLSKAGGALTGWLLTYAGVDKDTLGLRIGEATSGFYRSAAGVLGFVVSGVEVFRTAANGVLNFYKGVTVSLVTLNNVGGVFTPDCAAGVEFDCGTISAAATIANPINPPGAGKAQQISIKWTQDATGGRVMSFGGNCVNVGGTSANTAATKTNFAVGKVYPDGKFYYSLAKGA
jgi:hypothetical protein